MENYYESDKNAEVILGVAGEEALKSKSDDELIPRLNTAFDKLLLGVAAPNIPLDKSTLKVCKTPLADPEALDFPVEIEAVVGNSNHEDDVEIAMRILLKPSFGEKIPIIKIAGWKQIPSEIKYSDKTVSWGD
jgi:hypothetical protein